MSLSIDGVWKAGLWATTVWADGVWKEGGAPTPPAPSPQAERFSGGFAYPLDRPQNDGEKEADAVVEAVAQRQVVQPSTDAQQHFEELERELAARGLEWKVKYLESMNEQREALIRRRNAERMLLLIAAAI